MIRIYLILTFFSFFSLKGQNTELKNHKPPKSRMWIEMAMGPSSFTKTGAMQGGLGLNFVRNHHLFSLDWRDHYSSSIDSNRLVQCYQSPTLVHYNLYYGYLDSKGDKFWYAKGGLSLVRNGKHTGIATAQCENGPFEVNLYPGVPLEAGFGWKWYFIAAQFYVAALFYGKEAVGSLGFKLSLGAF